MEKNSTIGQKQQKKTQTKLRLGKIGHGKHDMEITKRISTGQQTQGL